MWFDKKSKKVKAILVFPIWGFIVSSIYRIVFYKNSTNKDKTTLICGICSFIPFIGFLISICDFISILISNKIIVMCE